MSQVNGLSLQQFLKAMTETCKCEKNIEYFTHVFH
jgi:hypothetical protein